MRTRRITRPATSISRLACKELWAAAAALWTSSGRPRATSRPAGTHRPAHGSCTADETQSSVDGNTVDMDVERAAFAENALQYEASVTFINGMLRTLQSAMQGQ
jgi:Flagellar basal body protein